MIFEEDDYLAHYGILRRSGRYPWGSGGDWGTGSDKTPAQRSMSYFDALAKLRAEGLSDAAIAQGWGMNTTELRQTTSLARNQKKQADIATAVKLKDKSYSNVAIGEKMGINESSVRNLLAASVKEKIDILSVTASMLRDRVAEYGFLDVGKGVEQHLGISREKLATAVAILKGEGYAVHPVQIDQLGTQNKTTTKVLAPPGTTYRDIVRDKGSIKSIVAVSDDGGRSFYGLLPPKPISSDRVAIRYAEKGGTEADGVLYVRPNVTDVSLGKNSYAQVRVNVDGTHYIKGMAMYKDNLPDGVDIMFNTNKSDTGNKLDALKKQSDDVDNPFGAVIKNQIVERNEKGDAVKVTSVMNMVNEQGDWDKWSRSLSSQTLSKQSPKLVENQLDMAFEKKRAELDSIMKLTNPAVKKKLLMTFSDAADSSAVHLKAASLPRSSWHAILPFNSMKEGEVYAPNFRDGETVALIRYPHGGKFEIPELVVNNSNRAAKKAINQAPDAIGINAEVAKRLSGADFDGDAVLVIPNNRGSIKTEPALVGLKNFDPQKSYPAYNGMHTIDGGTYNAATKSVEYGPKGASPRGKAKQMGDVSNLITDMTIQGATSTELAAAVRHSMVVIDSEKHALNYKESALANGIPALKAKYQEGANKGAATLISRARAEVRVPRYNPRAAKDGGPIDKATGRKVFEPTGETYDKVTVSKRTGEVKTTTVVKTQRSVKLAETEDAHTLSSGTRIESIYANHSNRLKSLANTARKEAVNTENIRISASAKKAYAPEVQSLTAKLNIALKNAPRERQAQVIGNTQYELKRQANPNMDEATRKKIRSQVLDEARRRTGAKKDLVDITPREWDAIQAGAITTHRLKEILDNADIEKVKQMATPKTALLMTSTKLSRARSMSASGYTQAEIADALGVSLTTLKNGLRDG